MLETKDVVAVLESLHVPADVDLAASIVRAHLTSGKTELDEGLVRQYLIDGGTEIPEIDPNNVIDEEEPPLTPEELSVEEPEGEE